MMDLVTRSKDRWSIFDDIDALQADINRVFSDFGFDTFWREGRYPLVNVWSSPDGVIVDAELPGADPKDVEVSVHGDELTVCGEIKAHEPRTGETCHRRERWSGEFSRTLKLPFLADAEAVKANHSNGVLRITVPRSAQDKPKKIEVQAA